MWSLHVHDICSNFVQLTSEYHVLWQLGRSSGPEQMSLPSLRNSQFLFLKVKDHMNVCLFKMLFTSTSRIVSYTIKLFDTWHFKGSRSQQLLWSWSDTCKGHICLSLRWKLNRINNNRWLHFFAALTSLNYVFNRIGNVARMRVIWWKLYSSLDMERN